MGRESRRNPTAQRRHAMVTTQIYDRFEQPLREGDIVLLLGKGDVFWRVTKAAPSLRPGATIGAVELAMVAIWQGSLPGGRPIVDLIRVRSAADEPASTTEGPETQVEPGGPRRIES